VRDLFIPAQSPTLPLLFLHLRGRKIRYDYLATKTHAIIIPSCGVDSVPADISVHLASKTLGHAPLGPSTTAATMYGGVPGGTIASFLATCEDVPQNHLAITMADYSLSPVPGAPSPLPRLVYSFDGIGVGALPPFGLVNRALVQRTAGLLELARRETRRGRGGVGTSEARREEGPACYGPAFTYTEFMPTGGVVSAFLYSAGFITTIATLMFIAPVRILCVSFGPLRFVRDRIRANPSSRFCFHSCGGCSSVW